MYITQYHPRCCLNHAFHPSKFIFFLSFFFLRQEHKAIKSSSPLRPTPRKLPFIALLSKTVNVFQLIFNRNYFTLMHRFDSENLPVWANVHSLPICIIIAKLLYYSSTFSYTLSIAASEPVDEIGWPVKEFLERIHKELQFGPSSHVNKYVSLTDSDRWTESPVIFNVRLWARNLALRGETGQGDVTRITIFFLVPYGFRFSRSTYNYRSNSLNRAIFGLIHTYIPLTLYPWRGSRGVLDIRSRYLRFTKIS
jgi:hypothetical protein